MIKSTAIYATATLTNAFVRFSILMIGGRLLLPDVYGALDTALFIGLVYSSVIIIGLDSAVLRLAFDKNISASKPENLLFNALLIIILTSLILSCVIILLVHFWNVNNLLIPSASIVAFISMFGIGFGVMAVCGSFMRSQFRDVAFLKATVLTAMLRICAPATFFFLNAPSLSTFLNVIGMTYLVSGLIFALFNMKPLKHSAISGVLMKQMLRFGAPLAPVIVFASALPMCERLIVGEIGGAVWLTLYSAAAFPALVLGITIQALNLAWTPLALKSLQDGDSEFIKKSAYILSFTMLLIYWVLAEFCVELIDLFIGLELTQADALFPFIGLVIVVRFISSFTSFGLIVMKRTEFKLLTQSLNFAVATLLSIYFGRTFGPSVIPICIFGTAFSVSIIEAVIASKIAPDIKLNSTFLFLPVCFSAGLLLI